MGNICEIKLLDSWNTAQDFEDAVIKAGNPFKSSFTQIIFRFPPNCKIMLDAAARLLSLANQLAFVGHSVNLGFDGENHKAMTYLNRAHFFTILSPSITIYPTQPDPSVPAKFEGNTLKLVEFKPIRLEDNQCHDSELAMKLSKSLYAILPSNFITTTVLATIFGELLSNIYEHSQSTLDGFVACQVYERGQRAQLVVSDSGEGVIETLRPTLKDRHYSSMSEPELISTILREGGLSRKGDNAGSGLHACATIAYQNKARIQIRLSSCSVNLNPSKDGYVLDKVYSSENLVPLKGTHICFDFPLDKI